jgi:sigma-B regulation protein RsbU (phosphoserine phosphatase)
MTLLVAHRCAVVLALALALTPAATCLGGAGPSAEELARAAETKRASLVDEIGRLTTAFRDMRDSLKTHIRDLEQTTRAKERLETEMKAARRIQADIAEFPKGSVALRPDTNSPRR